MASSPKKAALEGVSQRSHKLMSSPLSYIGAFFQAQAEGLWSEGNPDGWVPLVVAENKLGSELVLRRLEAVKDYPTWVMAYNNMKGVPELQAALARLLQHTFVKGVSIKPEHLLISAGCSAIIDNLFYIIADEGDGVLIPAPYYPAFDNDLTAKNNLRPLPFYLQEDPAADGSRSIEQHLDDAAAEAAARGIPVRALLVTNPNNPLGTIYSEATVKAMVAWCLRHKVHYVSDEIYALSIFKPLASPFVSAITLAQQLVGPPAGPSGGDGSAAAAAKGEHTNGGAAAAAGGGGGGNGASEPAGFSQRDVNTYVHMIYGLSKDWCASGLRVGILYSCNAPLHQALNSVCLFCGIPNWTSYQLAEALGDLPWVDDYLQQNQALLEASYDTLTGALEKEGIPFLPAVGGMFVWVDLRRWLQEPTWEGEAALWKGVCDSCRVILTPGKPCHAPAPGFFRLCFAWVPRQALADAVGRLGAHLRTLEAADTGVSSGKK